MTTSEKRNVIEPGRTPQPEGMKSAADSEDHVTKRAADAVADQLKDNELKRQN